MRTKASEAKLVLGGLLFTASLVSCYYSVFVKTGFSKSAGFVLFGIVPGRFGILLLKGAKQRLE